MANPTVGITGIATQAGGPGPITTPSGQTSQATGSSFLINLQQSGAAYNSGVVSDSYSNTYNIVKYVQTSDGFWLVSYLCVNGNGGTNHTATGSNPNGGGMGMVELIEIKNTTLTSPLDQSNSNTTAGTPCSCSVTPTSANQLVIGLGFAAAAGNTLTPSSHYTILNTQLTNSPSYTSAYYANATTSATDPDYGELYGGQAMGAITLSFKSAASSLVSSHAGSYTGTSTTYTLTEAAPSNDLIIVQWVLDNVSSAITPTISDSVNTGNYTQIGSTYYNASTSKSWGQHYMACNATGTPVITINGGVSSNNGQYLISHYQGFSTTPVLDANPAPVTGTASSFTNSITTAYAPEVAISNTFSGSTIASTPSGWTSTFSGGNGSINQTYYAYQTSASTYSIAVTLNASAFYYNWTFSFYSGVIGTTLVANSGSLTMTGEAATFTVSQLIPFIMLANPGPFDWIGAQAQVEANIYSNTGAFSMVGIPATFQNSTGAAYTLAAAFGAFAMTGQNAVLQTPTYLMSAFAGVFTLTGVDATLVANTGGIPPGYEMLSNLVGLDWLTASAVLWYGGYAEISPQVVKGTPIQMQEGIVLGQTPAAFSIVPIGCAVQLSIASSNLLSVSFESH